MFYHTLGDDWPGVIRISINPCSCRLGPYNCKSKCTQVCSFICLLHYLHQNLNLVFIDLLQTSISIKTPIKISIFVFAVQQAVLLVAWLVLTTVWTEQIFHNGNYLKKFLIIILSWHLVVHSCQLSRIGRSEICS